jgi:DNA-binding response OmpR family regulator
LCSSNRVDLAFIDVRLPDANGYELCRTLAAESGLEAMTLVLMSADPQLADNERVLAAGASDFLVNPISSRDLAEEVSRLLGEVPHHHESWIDLSAQPVRHAVEPQHVRLGLFGRPWIDTGTKRVSLRGGRSVELLATLAAACPTPVTSDRLGRYAWPPPDRASQNAVYTAMSRLRSPSW